MRRFGIALEILNRGQWWQVLLCDSRDVFLQDAPFRSNHEQGLKAAVHGGGASIPWGLDQACLNACAWRSDLGVPFITSHNHQGFALSLHHETRFQFNRDGRLINTDQSVVPVVHQYDRHPWLETMLRASLP